MRTPMTSPSRSGAPATSVPGFRGTEPWTCSPASSALLQDALDTYIHGSVTKAVDYVDGPIEIMATVTVMGVGSLYILGKTADPLSEMLKTFAIIAIVFTVAGSVGHYNEYLGNHLHDLPNDLMGVFAVGDAPTSEQGFGETMDEFGATAMDGISTIWYAGSGWSRIGFALLAMFLFAIFVLFAVAACVAMGIAMVGSSLVVGIGPIMILGLMLKPTREYFTRWVSYGIQFAVLAAFVGAVLGIMTDGAQSISGAARTANRQHRLHRACRPRRHHGDLRLHLRPAPQHGLQRLGWHWSVRGQQRLARAQRRGAKDALSHRRKVRGGAWRCGPKTAHRVLGPTAGEIRAMAPGEV